MADQKKGTVLMSAALSIMLSAAIRPEDENKSTTWAKVLGGAGRPGCHTPTVHVSHLPVGDVHLLVVTRRKGERHRVTSREDAISIRLHHLGESPKDERNEGKQAAHTGCRASNTPC